MLDKSINLFFISVPKPKLISGTSRTVHRRGPRGAQGTRTAAGTESARARAPCPLPAPPGREEGLPGPAAGRPGSSGG